MNSKRAPLSPNKLPKPVHFWEINGFVKLTQNARLGLKKSIQQYGVVKLAKFLNFDRETIYSIYCKGWNERVHSLSHLIKIACHLDIDLKELEREVTQFGTTQMNMYNISFPFVLSPLHLRAVSIHGDGSVNKNTVQCSWYQRSEHIWFMEQLLQQVLHSKQVRSYKKNDTISTITIPSSLVYLVCKSLNLGITEFNSIKFFEQICKLSEMHQFQTFCQLFVDEGHFKDTTMTIAQRKKETRKGLIMLLNSLKIMHSNPKNHKDDITIYTFNYSRIRKLLNNAEKDLGMLAGLWFKEDRFTNNLLKINEELSEKIVKSSKTNRMILSQLCKKQTTFCYQDVKNFNRTSAQVNKALRCWKKNKFITRIGWNKYRILKENIEDIS